MIAALLLATALAAPDRDARTVGGHTFGLPVAVEPVFLDRYLTFRQGVGHLRLRDVRYPGIPVPLELQLVGLTETLRVQVRLREGLALYGLASGQVFGGADADSALFLGASGGYELRLGAGIGLLRTDDAALVLRAGVRRAYGVEVTPVDLAVDLLDDTSRTLRRLTRGRWAEGLLATRRSLQGTLGLSGAGALSPHVGLLASLSARVGPTDVLSGAGEDTGLGVQLGAGAAVDVRGPASPFGLQLGLRDRVERLPGLVDSLPERHRLGAVAQGYVDLGQVELGLVPNVAFVWGDGVRETELGLEGRAVAWF